MWFQPRSYIQMTKGSSLTFFSGILEIALFNRSNGNASFEECVTTIFIGKSNTRQGATDNVWPIVKNFCKQKLISDKLSDKRKNSVIGPRFFYGILCSANSMQMSSYLFERKQIGWNRSLLKCCGSDRQLSFEFIWLVGTHLVAEWRNLIRYFNPDHRTANNIVLNSNNCKGLELPLGSNRQSNKKSKPCERNAYY